MNHKILKIGFDITANLVASNIRSIPTIFTEELSATHVTNSFETLLVVHLREFLNHHTHTHTHTHTWVTSLFVRVRALLLY